MRRPPGTIAPSTAAAAMAVLRGARTVREVAAALGYTSPTSALMALRAARRTGLVTWQDHHTGTLRPAVEVVANGTSTD